MKKAKIILIILLICILFVVIVTAAFKWYVNKYTMDGGDTTAAGSQAGDDSTNGDASAGEVDDEADTFMLDGENTCVVWANLHIKHTYSSGLYEDDSGLQTGANGSQTGTNGSQTGTNGTRTDDLTVEELDTEVMFGDTVMGISVDSVSEVDMTFTMEGTYLCNGEYGSTFIIGEGETLTLERTDLTDAIETYDIELISLK